MKPKTEEEIDEWYTHQLELLMKDYVHGVRVKLAHEFLQKDFKIRAKKIKLEYDQLFSAYLKSTGKRKKSTKTHLEKPFGYLKIIHKKPEEKKESFSERSFRMKSRFDLFKFRLRIKYKNTLDKLHLSYPIFYVKRSYKLNYIEFTKNLSKTKIYIVSRYDLTKLAIANRLLKMKNSLLKRFKKKKEPKPAEKKS